MKIEIVVTRHPGLVTVLRERGLVADDCVVLSHAGPDQLRGKSVCGVLPHSLSCLCSEFSEIPLDLPAELRGKELSADQVRLYGGALVTYVVARK